MRDDGQALPIASSMLSTRIALRGAEMQDLSDGDGRRLQWDGDPEVWAGRAPLLFPIVGMLHDGVYRLDGRSFAMPKHGFARHALFDVVAHDERSAHLRLSPDDTTRACYPFEFTLDVVFTVAEAELSVVATIANHGATPMPASVGFHPAFRWPLPYGRPRADHAIRFAHDEPAPVRRIDAKGLLTPEPHPTPVDGNLLVLRDEYFDDDALIFDRLASRRVRYGAADGPQIELRFDDFPMLGVWTKPGGAEFICIEPWQGCADPVGYAGDIWSKPGIVRIEPGRSRRFAMTIAVVS